MAIPHNSNSIVSQDLARQHQHRSPSGDNDTHLIPTETYLNLSEQERIQAFLLLQQRMQALEGEIARHNEAEKRLRMLAAIVESTDDAVLSKTLDGTITSWNRSAERIYGYTAQEIVGQHVTRIFPPNREEEFEGIMQRIRQGKSVDHHETRRMRKDGRLLNVSVTISPVRDEAGTIIGASTIARDITEQRLLEAKSHQLFASNLVSIFVVDTCGQILEANQAFLHLLGEPISLDEHPLLVSLAPELGELVSQTCQSQGTSEPQEILLHRRNGQTVPVLVAVTPLAQSGTCIGFVLDISERKALEQRKDAFIGMASHELKTPITSLKGFLGVARRLMAVQDYEKVLHCLTRMDVQIDKLTKLINDLLDLSRMQTGQLVYREEPVEMDQLIKETVESVQEATQTHRLQIKGEAHSTLFGDRDRLGQVLINLLNNAIKYSPQADTVIIHIASDEREIRISVQDFGMGIASEHHPHIFERFYQVTTSDERSYPGLGIGLAITHDIVKRHGGSIRVESEIGHGATFHLSFPRIQPANHPNTSSVGMDR